MADKEFIQLLIQAKDLASRVVLGVKSTLEKLPQTNDQVKSSFASMENTGAKAASTLQNIGSSASSATGFMMKLGAFIAGGALTKSFIDINASAEKTKLMLTAMYGDANKAGDAFQWIQKTATEVPFSMGGIQDAFIKLKAAGIDPTNGFAGEHCTIFSAASAKIDSIECGKL